MRIELAGSLIRPKPLVITYDPDVLLEYTFDPLPYMDLGYVYFDVICIGGGGGVGGGINTENTGTRIKSFGGAGGGGGYHRVRGLLSALPNSCPVIVGAAGTPGTDHISDPNLTTHGSDGGYSSFNTNTCRASGGGGGKRVTTNSVSLPTEAHGGTGGAGNRIAVGGGAPGGLAGVPPSSLNTPGTDGTLLNNIGKGGGGGAGGVSTYDGITHMEASAGGRGSYNPGDTSVYGPGDAPSDSSITLAVRVIPGGASGAKASPLNGLPTVYGQSKSQPVPSTPGVVILRLTVE